MVKLNDTAHTGAQVVFDNVGYRYSAKGAMVLDGLNLSIAESEFFLLLGPSGCGKTTALNLLAGFERASAGTITADGRTIAKAGPDRVVIFQGDDSLLSWLDARKNVEFGLRLAGVHREERQERAMAALRRVGLEAQAHKYPHELSGGMKQRVQIARALVTESPILLMDEPFAALDAQNRAILQDEMSHIWATTRRTVLFITHDIAESIILADRVAVMTAGPNASIKKIFDISLDRPRQRGDVEFAAMYAEIEASLAAETWAAREEGGDLR